MTITKQAYTRKRASSYNMEDALYDIDCLGRFLLKDKEETIEDCARRTLKRYGRFAEYGVTSELLRKRAAVARLLLAVHEDPFQATREAGALLRRES